MQLLAMEELIPGLQPLVLWMANSIELLHFIQHHVPQLLPWRQDEEDDGRHDGFDWIAGNVAFKQLLNNII